MINYQLIRDKERRWKKAFEGDAPTWGDNHPAMKLAVLATIVREVRFQDVQIKHYFGNVDSHLGKETIAITSGCLINDNKRPHEIYALEPDLLGTWFVLYCFCEGLVFEDLLDIAWQYSPDKTAVFLLRITQDFIDLPKEYEIWDVIEKLLVYKPPHEKHYLPLANVATAIVLNLYQKELTIPKNIITALEHAANSSDSAAITTLGFFYNAGIGVAKKIEKAIHFYKQAVKIGDGQAMANLGVCYENAEGVAQDLDEAISLYRCAIELGNSHAMANLGVCYAKGKGVKQNWGEAISLYCRAAELSNSYAMSNLGHCYQKGEGVAQDWDEAISLYQRAVELCNSSAMVNLGVCYENGAGIGQDWDKAICLYRRAVELGNSHAMTALGYCYASGEGVGQDWDKAIGLFRRAVKVGETGAFEFLRNISLLENFLGKGPDKARKIKRWTNNKRPRLAKGPVFDHPIMAGDWKQLAVKEVAVCLDKLMVSFEVLGLFENLDGYFGQYGRSLPLSFYKDCNLVDIQLYNPSNKNTILFSAITNTESGMLLNGELGIVDDLNLYLLDFHDQESILDYLQFLCSYVHDNGKPYQIISNLNEIPFEKEASQDIQVEIKKSLFNPRYIEGSFEKEGWQQFKANIIYGNTLCVSTFKVLLNGDITMEGYTIILDQLPILQRRYDGVFRTPLLPLK